MLYREIIAVCSQTYTEHINTLCGQNVELLNFKPGDKCNKQDLNGLTKHFDEFNIERCFLIRCCRRFG
jgi:hypothetical protein